MIKRSEAKPAVGPLNLSLFELVEGNDWHVRMRSGHPGLFNWRTALALALRDVPIRPIVAQLWPVFEQMADQVDERLTATVADGTLSVPSFADWLALWREQLFHWHDQVRTLVCQYCPEDAAACLSGQFALLDGFSFADFVLTAVVAFEQRQHLATLLNGHMPTPRVMPDMIHGAHYSDVPAMSWACTYLYARFQHNAPFCTMPAPARPITWADVANIYPDLNTTDRQSPNSLEQLQ
jgi:hypothetical protein